MDGSDLVALVDSATTGSTLVYLPRAHYQTAVATIAWSTSSIADVAVLPDGALDEVAWGALPTGDGYLVEETVFGVVDDAGDLLDPQAAQRARAERATDAIRKRFGADAIVKGRGMR